MDTVEIHIRSFVDSQHQNKGERQSIWTAGKRGSKRKDISCPPSSLEATASLATSASLNYPS